MRILLIITGSIAAVKSLELIRLLREQNIAVTCVLTKGGAEFVTPLSCAAFSGNKVYSELFPSPVCGRGRGEGFSPPPVPSPETRREGSLGFPPLPHAGEESAAMDHIRLSRENDLIVVAPASADFLAKMAHGLADDLASTLMLATDKPVLVAPAMNVKMWEHKATQRNVRQLREDGIAFVGPVAGELACGEEGEGRMAEPEEIFRAIEQFLTGKGERRARKDMPLMGRKALVTSGPTREGIDPVRYLSNYSSGKQGHAIASALHALGAEVTLISGPTSLPDPAGVHIIHVESAREMMDACLAALPVDIAVCTAAVADWTVAHFSEEKIKKSGIGEDFNLVFTENPDILMELSRHRKHRPALVIGFAAESEHVVENARVKLERKGCDWILANDISGRKVFSSNENCVHFLAKNAEEHWPKLSKQEVGSRLAAKAVEFFAKEKPAKLKIVSS